MNIAFDFKIKHPQSSLNEPAEFCVFSVLVGDASVSKGAIVPAKGVPEVEDKEPVYEVRTGYALTGGTWPAAKGKRSRGGAPGTQFALEIDAQGNERYYLLNTAGGHKVRIQADSATEVELVSDTDYVELLYNETQPVRKELLLDTTGERMAFHKKAVAAAARCGLPGRDPLFTAALERLAQEKVPVPPPDKDQPGKGPNPPGQK